MKRIMKLCGLRPSLPPQNPNPPMKAGYMIPQLKDFSLSTKTIKYFSSKAPTKFLTSQQKSGILNLPTKPLPNNEGFRRNIFAL